MARPTFASTDIGNRQSGWKPSFTCVVTNSHTTPVQNKRTSRERNHQDFDWLIERVHGSARKYVIDESFTEIQESLSIPNLSRPIYLRSFFDQSNLYNNSMVFLGKTPSFSVTSLNSSAVPSPVVHVHDQ